MITIEEYRRMLNDRGSTSEQIEDRLRYLEALCRNAIKSEIATYVEGTKNPDQSS